MASSSPFCLENENSVPPVPLANTSTGLSTKMDLVDLKISTINGTKLAELPWPPVVCITVFGVAGTLGGGRVAAGGNCSGRGAIGREVSPAIARDMFTE